MAAGCGGTGAPTGTLGGKVTYQGAPAPSGAIIQFYHAEAGHAASGVIQADGTYEAMLSGAKQLPVGKYAVHVSPPKANPDEVPPEYPNLPEKYRQAETSGLSVEIRQGQNVFDLDLFD